ncbi:hypothetical protein Tco_0430917 [Tanacetum coccineum]
MLEQILTGNPQQKVVNFLAERLISCQGKKADIVATSTTEAEYVAAASCCGQVLWIQNQMLDYGFNFMNTKIYIDNESTICIVKNPVYHSKTKHIAIRHHFIRDAYEKKLIQVLKIHTDDNVADLLTKAFDVSSVNTPVTYIVHSLVGNSSYRQCRVSTAGQSLYRYKDQQYGRISREGLKGMPKFHEIHDFLTRSSILHCSHAHYCQSSGMPPHWCLSLEASIRGDLLVDDAKRGVRLTPNQAIFDAILLIGVEGDLTDKSLANVPVPLDHFPVNALTSKVFSFMVKKGKQFLGNVTPLFASMLVQPTEDEGVPSERPSEAQPTPSPPHSSEAPFEPQTDPSPPHSSEAPFEPQTDPSPRPSPSTIIPDSIPESSGGNLGGLSSSDKSLSGNEGEMTL